MALDELRSLLGRCTLSAERFDAIHCGPMGVFEPGIIVFDPTPYLSIVIVARPGVRAWEEMPCGARRSPVATIC